MRGTAPGEPDRVEETLRICGKVETAAALQVAKYKLAMLPLRTRNKRETAAPTDPRYIANKQETVRRSLRHPKARVDRLCASLQLCSEPQRKEQVEQQARTRVFHGKRARNPSRIVWGNMLLQPPWQRFKKRSAERNRATKNSAVEHRHGQSARCSDAPSVSAKGPRMDDETAAHVVGEPFGRLGPASTVRLKTQ